VDFGDRNPFVSPKKYVTNGFTNSRKNKRGVGEIMEITVKNSACLKHGAD
jgi:hypothetical protein